MEQEIISGIHNLPNIINEIECKRIFLVCDSSYPYLNIRDKIEELSVPYEKFSRFTSNPLYEDVKKGVEQFNAACCDAILAVGGGSAMDVAKCIKLYCRMDPELNYLAQEYKDTGIPLIAVPTTAGTGSESTRFAVIYFEGQKQSVMHESIRPDYALLEPAVLETLPMYQKKCTLLDALCQGIESWWNVNSTDESKGYAKAAVESIVKHMDIYFGGSKEAAREIMRAANLAGQAINITQTTAAHAMSYKLTSMYGLPHGNAVAVCLPEVWAYMLDHPENCIDVRGGAYLEEIFQDIAEALGCNTPKEAVEFFHLLLRKLEIQIPKAKNRKAELDVLAGSVNPARLKNNPVALSEEVMRKMYERIVKT